MPTSVPVYIVNQCHNMTSEVTFSKAKTILCEGIESYN